MLLDIALDAQRGRDGRVRYWYFRRSGRRWGLPGEPDSESFLTEYRRLLATTTPATPGSDSPNPPGSVGALILDYLALPEFKRTKPSTQRVDRSILEPIGKRIGHHAVAFVERRHIKAMRDEKADTPGMAK